MSHKAARPNTAKRERFAMEDPSVVNAEYWLSWMPIVRNVAAALVAIGVVMEFAEGWVSEPLRKIVDDARNRQVAQLASDLEASRAEVAGANARAAEATQKAAEATLELAKFKAPRTLTEAQQGAITDRLRGFGGTKYDAGIGPAADPEPLYLLRTIAASLTNAGWVQVQWTGNPSMAYDDPPMPSVGLTMVTNVIVDVHPEYWDRLGPAAEALAQALSAQGIAAAADSKPTTIHAEVIHLRIGRKL
jgi:hypothetical protein